MSSADNRVAFLSIAIGTLLPAAFAAMVGSSMALWIEGWQGAVAAVQGAVCGAGMALVVGFVMAWHGGAIGGSPSRCATAAIWGVVTGAVVGFSLGPPLGAAFGLLFGQIAGGALIGLATGGIVGVAAWELAFSADEIIEMIRRRRSAAR